MFDALRKMFTSLTPNEIEMLNHVLTTYPASEWIEYGTSGDCFRTGDKPLIIYLYKYHAEFKLELRYYAKRGGKSKDWKWTPDNVVTILFPITDYYTTAVSKYYDDIKTLRKHIKIETKINSTEVILKQLRDRRKGV